MYRGKFPPGGSKGAFHFTIRRQRPTWFGNIRDFKDEMHLKILKKLCMHKITINQCEFVIFASQGVSRSTTVNHMLWGAE